MDYYIDEITMDELDEIESWEELVVIVLDTLP